MKMTIVAANSTSLISEPYGNITLTPNEIKLSFEIITGNEDMMDGFFGGGISQNASITLNLRVNATSQIMSANGGAASEISFSQGGNSGYFPGPTVQLLMVRTDLCSLPFHTMCSRSYIHMGM